MSKRLVWVSALCIYLSACATTQVVNPWGNYEQNLYDYLHTPAKKERVLAEQLAFLARCESRNQKPAPGLFAEAGTMLLLAGEKQEAIKYYAKEREAWPESAHVMTSIIDNLQKDTRAQN